VKLEAVAASGPTSSSAFQPARTRHHLARRQAAPEAEDRPDRRLKEGRPTGVEDLNGLIDEPLNRGVTSTSHGIERGQRDILAAEPSPSSLDHRPFRGGPVPPLECRGAAR